MNIESKSRLAADVLEIEDVDLETAEGIIDILSDLCLHTGKTAARLYVEAVGIEKTFSQIIRVLELKDNCDSRKIKTISKLISAMPGRFLKAATETEKDKFKRFFRSCE